MSDLEALSRLLDGDLSAEEAEALRARIAAEPALSARWEAMRALPGALARLPLPSPAPALRPRRRLPAWLPLAAAALLGLGLALAWPSAPELWLASGTQLVEGSLVLRAGDRRVALDGRARIDVEPPPGAARVMEAKEDPMLRHTLAGALAGAAITITVYEGRACLSGGEGPEITVEAGESRTVGGPEARPRPGGAQAAQVLFVGEDSPEARAAALAGQVETLAAENERLNLELAMARGQVAAHEGVAQDWPAGLPEVMQPAAYERFLRARLAGMPEARLESLDCSEYPCIAVISSAAPGEDWQERLQPVHDDLEAAGFGDAIRVMGAGMSKERDDADPVHLYGFAVMVGQEDPDAAQRTQYRLREDLEAGSGE